MPSALPLPSAAFVLCNEKKQSSHESLIAVLTFLLRRDLLVQVRDVAPPRLHHVPVAPVVLSSWCTTTHASLLFLGWSWFLSHWLSAFAGGAPAWQSAGRGRRGSKAIRNSLTV